MDSTNPQKVFVSRPEPVLTSGRSGPPAVPAAARRAAAATLSSGFGVGGRYGNSH